MPDQVRVRYAPSPTGYPHVGNIRSALFNWLFARHSKGVFIVRIEDTDVARTVPGTVEAILAGLHWLGIEWDEGPDIGGKYGPYTQSQRLPMYEEAARKLVAQDNAYHCYCSSQRLEEMRAEQTRLKMPPGYDRHCRSLTAKERADQEASGIKPVVRFKSPLEGQTTFHDLIRGDVTFENKVMDDFVLLKSDGYPTYHLANIVDDHAMEISHVMRAEEWLSSTPRHVLLYRAMGYEPPKFAHLPLILGTDRSKLAKRHGATSITDYETAGYLPEAMLNFLTLLGWSLDAKTEIMTADEIIANFSIERISPTAAIFNREKLDWMNGQYIRKLSVDEFMQRALPFLEKGLPPNIKRPLDMDYVRQLMPLVQERAKTLAEAPGLAAFFFTEELEYDVQLLIEKNMTAEGTIKALEAARERLAQVDVFVSAPLEALLRPMAAELGLKTGQFFGALRTATTGQTAAPPLFQTMEVLGKDRCMKRIDAALAKLRSRPA